MFPSKAGNEPSIVMDCEEAVTDRAALEIVRSPLVRVGDQ